MPEVRERGTRWSIALLPDLGERIVETARGYLGVPFCHAGRSKEHGVDCIGLLACIAHELELTTYDDRNYGRLYPAERLRAELEKFCNPLAATEVLRPGDILLLSVYGISQHVAIYTGEGTLIHAPEMDGKGCVMEVPFDGAWKRVVAGRYRWREPAG